MIRRTFLQSVAGAVAGAVLPWRKRAEAEPTPIAEIIERGRMTVDEIPSDGTPVTLRGVWPTFETAKVFASVMKVNDRTWRGHRTGTIQLCCVSANKMISGEWEVEADVRRVPTTYYSDHGQPVKLTMYGFGDIHTATEGLA